MEILTLDGTWSASRKGENDAFPAEVPGCIHKDLLNDGRIPDPYFRDNENRLQWIAEADWIYRRSFDLSPEFLDHESINLCCEGLDTFATLQVNGKEVARTDNMFRSWQFPVRSFLQAGQNEITVTFSSTLPWIRERQEAHPLRLTGAGIHRLDGSNWIRKEQCNYGWDWGPMLVTCGIWRPMRLVASSGARLGPVQVLQDHQDGGSVRLDVVTEIVGEVPPGHTLITRLSREGEEVNRIQSDQPSSPCSQSFSIGSPELWWPNGIGAQPLYEVSVALVDPAGEVLEQSGRRIGLRHFDLVREPDAWGQSFSFRINGLDFFAKGANWIPADTFDARVSDEDLEDLLKSAADAHMNCIRVWGGGLYERNRFYDLCDELGLCVWQDFMFACAAYPAHEPSFMESVAREAEDNVKRLRHHPSVVLWCGNNEIEQIKGLVGEDPEAMEWQHYCALFDDLLANIVATHHPGCPYWPSSEHSPVGNRTSDRASQDPRWGDAHLWNVWHGQEPFEWYRSSFHRFCSEFGFQSFPHPRTVEGYTDPEDRNITSYVMEHHQRSRIGNSRILTYLLDWFRLPSRFEDLIQVSQILQGLAIKYAVEHWRRNMPRCMGALYWQLNDCWPVASWASIDHLHRWKALHYEARRFFAPVLVSAVEDPDNRKVEVFVTSDGREPVPATLSWSLESVHGTLLESGERPFSLPTAGTESLGHLDFARSTESLPASDLMLFLHVRTHDKTVSRNLVTFVRPKHLALQNPSLRWSFEGTGIRVQAENPALWVWIEGDDPDIRWSDTFFHLQAGESRLIHPSRPGQGSTPEATALAGIRVRSLYETTGIGPSGI